MNLAHRITITSADEQTHQQPLQNQICLRELHERHLLQRRQLRMEQSAEEQKHQLLFQDQICLHDLDDRSLQQQKRQCIERSREMSNTLEPQASTLHHLGYLPGSPAAEEVVFLPAELHERHLRQRKRQRTAQLHEMSHILEQQVPTLRCLGYLPGSPAAEEVVFLPARPLPPFGSEAKTSI